MIMLAEAPTLKPLRRRRDWRPDFLEAFAETLSVTAAAKAAGVKRATAYLRRKTDPAFAAAWDEALQSAVDGLEAACFRRAIEGSDALGMFLLRAWRPEIYGNTCRRCASSSVSLVALDVRVVFPDGAEKLNGEVVQGVLQQESN